MKHILLLVLACVVSSNLIAETTKITTPAATITLKAQVFCNESGNRIESELTIITEDDKKFKAISTGKGEFSAQFPATVSVTILANADGYESAEVVYTIPNVSQDTTVSIKVYMTPAYELILEGNVLDAKTNLPISAELDVFFDSDIIKEDVEIIHDGKYREVVLKPGWYILDILSPGYISISDTAWVTHSGTRHVIKDYKLTPIEVGLNVVIENLYFYFGHTELKSESATSLNKIVEFIQANPTIELEIAGHTDDEGADDYNLLLSQGRAEAVVKYLVKLGVAPSRLTARGYGETKPIDLSKTKVGKAKNRRVEFTILKK